VWVEILLDKYFSYRPTERLLASWRLLDLDLAPGTVTDGLQRLEVLLRPIYKALKERNPHGDLHQGDETRWRVFVILEGKEGYGWWLWVVLSLDTVVYLLDASRQSPLLHDTRLVGADQRSDSAVEDATGFSFQGRQQGPASRRFLSFPPPCVCAAWFVRAGCVGELPHPSNPRPVSKHGPRSPPPA